jgi:hypothetical protein
MTSTSWARIGGGMGIPFVVVFVVIVLIAGDSPDDQASDTTILDYYASHGNRVRDIVSFFLAVAGLALFVWFLGHLRAMLSAADVGGRSAGIVLASGTAFIALLSVAAAAGTAISVVISDAGDKFTLDPNTFRIVTVLSFLTFIAAFLAAAPLAFAIGVVAWRTRLLPRWLAVASFVGGLGALGGFAFVPTVLWIAWVLLLSGYLALRPWEAGAPAPAT